MCAGAMPTLKYKLGPTDRKCFLNWELKSDAFATVITTLLRIIDTLPKTTNTFPP